MSGQVCMITNRFYVVIDIRIDVWPSLLVIRSALHDMKKMRDDTTRCTPLPVVIEIKSPRIRQSTSKDFKCFPSWMVSPNTSINKLTLCICITWLPNIGMRKHAVATVQPTIRTPNETIERFMPILNTPSVKQDLWRPIRNIITIFIRDKRKVWWRPNKHPTKSTGDPGCERQRVRKRLLFIEDAVAIRIFKYLNTTHRIVCMFLAGLVIKIFHNPHPATIIETEGDGLSDIGLSSKNRDFKSIRYGHFRNCFRWL